MILYSKMPRGKQHHLKGHKHPDTSEFSTSVWCERCLLILKKVLIIWGNIFLKHENVYKQLLSDAHLLHLFGCTTAHLFIAGEGAHVPWCPIVGAGSSLPPCGSQHQAQGTRLGSKGLYLLSHLTGPLFGFNQWRFLLLPA